MDQTIDSRSPSDPDPGPDDGSQQPGRALSPSAVAVVVAAVVIAGSLLVLLRGSDEETGEVAIDAAAIENLAFLTEDGSEATLADYEGKPLVVNFFASWCAPCRGEMPDLEEVHQAAGDQVAFLGINHDITESSWKSMVAETEISFPTVFQPDQEIYRELELFGMPSTVLIDADGEVVHVYAGALSSDALKEQLAEYLGVEA